MYINVGGLIYIVTMRLMSQRGKVTQHDITSMYNHYDTTYMYIAAGTC